MQTVVHSHNLAKGRILNNCPFCGKMPVLNGVSVKMHPVLLFLYSGQRLDSDWACPSCYSVFDKDNNLIVMGKIDDWQD